MKPNSECPTCKVFERCAQIAEQDEEWLSPYDYGWDGVRAGNDAGKKIAAAIRDEARVACPHSERKNT